MAGTRPLPGRGIKRSSYAPRCRTARPSSTRASGSWVSRYFLQIFFLFASLFCGAAGPVQCATCGGVYSVGDPVEEASHDRMHQGGYSIVQYSTVEYSTVKYSNVEPRQDASRWAQYSTVQYSRVQYSTVHQCRATTGCIKVGTV